MELAPALSVRRRRGWMVLAGATLALFVGLSTPLSASAHAVVLSSQPGDGAQLGLAPGAVVLRFSEALNPTLSQATVTEASNRTLTSRPTSVQEIRVDLVTNSPGLYRVHWVAVSRDDGHTTEGNLSFTVAAHGAHGQGTTGASLSATDLTLAAARWLEDGALLLAVGMLFIRWVARTNPELTPWVRPRLLPPLLTAFIAGCVVITAEAVTASGGDLAGAIGYFGSGPSGLARLARVGLELHAVLAVSRSARVLWPAVLAPVVALAASGHAVGNAAQLGGVALDSTHVIAAGLWAGGIMAMATLRPPGGWRRDGRGLLARFTPWALGAFAVTVSAGVLQAALNLGSVAALAGTTYGRVLIAKGALVALMAPFSLVAWRLRRPRMRTEGLVAVTVVAASALLASSPVPARGATLPTGGPPAATVGLPRGSQLTLGEHAGKVLVGLTIEPARPGPNWVTVYVLPLDGASAAAQLDVSSSVATRPLPLTPCGDPCRNAQVSLFGNEAVMVSVGGRDGGTARFTIPPLPAADGATVLASALAKMRALHSYAMHESLTSSGTTFFGTDYQAVAPDRLAWTQDTGSASIVIGPTQYNREAPGKPWTKEDGPVISEPAFVWDLFAPYIGARALAHETVDGVATTVIGFFGRNSGTPVWFRLWIDDTGLVHRAEMRAPGHFMDESFHDFDAAIAISAPPAMAVTPSSPAP